MHRCILLVVVACLTRPAAADVLVDTFDKQYGVDSYRDAGGSIIGPLANNLIEEDNAYNFTVDAGLYQLDSIVVGIRRGSGHGTIDLSLHANGPGDTVGPLIEAFNLGEPIAQNGSFYTATLEATSTLRPLLEAGQRYWLVASATDSLWAIWGANSGGTTYVERYVRQGADGDWVLEFWRNDYAAFAVHATPVPEPGTALLLLVGLGFALGRPGQQKRPSRF